jgi:hypothetical protein
MRSDNKAKQKDYQYSRGKSKFAKQLSLRLQAKRTAQKGQQQAHRAEPSSTSTWPNLLSFKGKSHAEHWQWCYGTSKRNPVRGSVNNVAEIQVENLAVGLLLHFGKHLSRGLEVDVLGDPVR